MEYEENENLAIVHCVHCCEMRDDDAKRFNIVQREFIYLILILFIFQFISENFIEFNIFDFMIDWTAQ